MIEASIVIPNYNGEKLLAKNLAAVLKAAQAGQVEVIVVDDASTDNSVDLLRSRFPQVKLVGRLSHQGFAGTVNAGVARAKGRVVVLLNTDVLPEEDFLTYLLPHFENDQVFAVGCLEKSLEPVGVVFRGRGVGEFKRGFLIHAWADPAEGQDTLWVSAGSGAFDRQKWLKLGGMRTVYDPFYYEDIDLSWRAQKQGWRILIEPKAVVVHKHEQGAIRSFYSPAKIKQIAYRNQFFFVWLNITKKSWLINHLIWLPVHLVQALLRGDWPLLMGFLKALRKIRLVLAARKSIQESGPEVISDEQLLK